MSTLPAIACPAFTTTTCIVVRCCDCDDTFGYDDETHFLTLESARRNMTAAGWSRAHDAEPVGRDIPADAERWRCRDCTAVRACAVSGHQPYTPQPWIDPRTGVHVQHGQICERCSASLTKPTCQRPPADYPTAAPMARHLYWDHTSLPEGADLATAVAVLIDQANAVDWR
ncbi:hypothetical protein ACFQ08_37670, partial [Streptosporangium algeriense]